MANGINLADIEINPANRQEQFTDINKVNKSLAQSAQQRQKAVDSSMELLNEVSVDTTKRKAMHDQETAEGLDTLLSGFQEELNVIAPQFLRQQALYRTQNREMDALNAQMNDPNLPHSERKKAEKQFESLSEEAYVTRRGLENMATAINTTIATRERLAGAYDSARAVEYQKEMDISAHVKATRLQSKIKRLQAGQESENIQAGLINQMRSLTPQEAENANMEQSSTMRYMYFLTQKGSPEAMQKFGKQERSQMLQVFSSLSSRSQEDLMKAAPIFMRAEASGEELDFTDVVGMTARVGKLGTLEEIANLSGDADLQRIIRQGKEPYREQVQQQLVQDYQQANGVPPQGNALKSLNQQAEAIVGDAYARDIVGAAFNELVQETSAMAGGAGQAIYSTDSAEMPIDRNAYSNEVLQVVDSDSFQAAISRKGSDVGNEILSRSDDMMKVFEQNGFTSERKQLQAAQFIADLNRQSALRYVRERNSFASSEIDYLGNIGYTADEGILQMEMPRNLSRIATNAGSTVKPIYDYSDGSDLMAALEVLRSYKSFKESIPQRAAEASPAGRTRSISDALQSFNR